MREVVRAVQAARKQAGLQVDDRIALGLSADAAELQKTIHEYADVIAAETLATHMTAPAKPAFETVAMVEGSELRITLGKA